MNGILTQGGFWNIRSLMEIFLIRKILVTQVKEIQFYATIKTQRPSENRYT